MRKRKRREEAGSVEGRSERTCKSEREARGSGECGEERASERAK